MLMTTIIIVGVLIVLLVVVLSWVTTSKAYAYKHTIDPIENNPHLKKLEESEQDSRKD
ncbi:YtzI protein [Heyndrickxia acidicola]|uniref:YtzI protein n=1 Tax=Heyndrickxia acidicola TaxID=209389 RepID=A0ABU6MR20_9BACI|nr:YtzI protein [Heyndrickxia acidicola]MED1206068.1 YtzI protein [Heyndrickxia acidicola]